VFSPGVDRTYDSPDAWVYGDGFPDRAIHPVPGVQPYERVTGFKSQHCHYFLQHDDDDARHWIREQVKSFADLVLASLKAEEPFYDSFDIGSLKRDQSECWVAFGPSDYTGVTRQTISPGSNGFRIFVNTETKPAIDRLRSVLKRSEPEARRALPLRACACIRR
jgi:hypothetical protein